MKDKYGNKVNEFRIRNLVKPAVTIGFAFDVVEWYVDSRIYCQYCSGEECSNLDDWETVDNPNYDAHYEFIPVDPLDEDILREKFKNIEECESVILKICDKPIIYFDTFISNKKYSKELWNRYTPHPNVVAREIYYDKEKKEYRGKSLDISAYIKT